MKRKRKRKRDVNNLDGLRSAVCNNAVGGAPIGRKNEGEMVDTCRVERRTKVSNLRPSMPRIDSRDSPLGAQSLVISCRKLAHWYSLLGFSVLAKSNDTRHEKKEMA